MPPIRSGRRTVQSLKPTELAAADRTALRDRLLEIVSLDDEVLAERATISLPTVLTESDGALVCRQLEHPNETVRHNLLSWLVTTFDPERSAALESLFDDASVLSSSGRLHDVMNHLRAPLTAGAVTMPFGVQLRSHLCDR